MPVTDLTSIFGELVGHMKEKAIEYIGFLVILCSFIGGLCALALAVEWPL